VVSDEETGAPFNTPLSHKLRCVRSFNSEINRNPQIELGRGEHISLKGPRFGALDGYDRSNDYCIGLIDTGDLVGSVFLDLFDHGRGGHSLDIRGHGRVFKNRNSNPMNPFHVGWRSRAQGVASAADKAPKQNTKKLPAYRATNHWEGRAGSTGAGDTSFGAVRIGFCSGAGWGVWSRFCDGAAGVGEGVGVGGGGPTKSARPAVSACA